VSPDVAAPTSNSEKQLAWEARHRGRAGVAAMVGAIGLFIYFALGQIISRDTPTAASGLDTLVRAARPGDVGNLPSLQVPYFEYVESKSTLFLIMSVAAFLGFGGLSWAAGFLAVATRARMPTFRRYQIYLPIVGGVVLAISLVLLNVAQTIQVNAFLDGSRTVREASDVDSGVFAFAKLLGFIGALVLAIGLILVSMNSMRVGLLTKFYGFVGIVAGAMLVICPLAVVHTVWLVGLGLLFLGRWPGGDLPAWKTGNAEPWPVPERAQRRARVATDPPAPATAGPNPRRKRKKRH
jgi:hypothetical protein